MRDPAYISYLENVVLSLLHEREELKPEVSFPEVRLILMNEDEVVVTGMAYTICNIKEAIRQHQQETVRQHQIPTDQEMQDMARRMGKGRPQKAKAYSVAEIRQQHAQAYAPWTAATDGKLRSLFAKHLPIGVIAKQLGRKPGAIRSRIAKLGLS